MKIPHTLRIGGRTYKIVYPHVFKDSCQVLHGQQDSAGQTIKITDKDAFGTARHPQSIEQTFWHEVLHAIDNIYIADSILSLENGEHIIDQLAEGIAQVLRDNKLGRG